MLLLFQKATHWLRIYEVNFDYLNPSLGTFIFIKLDLQVYFTLLSKHLVFIDDQLLHFK